MTNLNNLQDNIFNINIEKFDNLYQKICAIYFFDNNIITEDIKNFKIILVFLNKLQYYLHLQNQEIEYFKISDIIIDECLESINNQIN
ncbi:hypothetical protein AB837_00638 [bacterium AB1]|nr:hypothetical protein AB837_00638 [bacterium AB1]